MSHLFAKKRGLRHIIPMEQLSTRLRDLRRKHRKTQADVASWLNITRQTYAKFEAEEAPISSDKLLKLAEYYNTTTDYILKGNPIQQTPHRNTLPVMGFADCGLKDWFSRTDAMSVHLERPTDLKDPDAFAVIAQGTSMQPEGIRPGYLCIVSPAHSCHLGDAVFVRDKNKKSALKKLVKQDEKWVHLQGFLPENKNGQQEAYIESWNRGQITLLAPVITIKRRYF